MRRLVTALVATVALTLLAAVPAYADHLKTTLDASAQASAHTERGCVLTAHLATSDGKAVADMPLRFYDVVDFIGEREMLIGTATTNGRGVATLEYLPAQAGDHQIVVRFDGHEHLTPAIGRTVARADLVAPQRTTERSPLAAFSDRVPYGVAVVVLAVWGLIAFAFISTARSVLRARDPTRKEDTA